MLLLHRRNDGVPDIYLSGAYNNAAVCEFYEQDEIFMGLRAG
jgi:hypothetical protein